MDPVMVVVETLSGVINLWVDVENRAELIKVVFELPAHCEHLVCLCVEAVGDNHSRQYHR